MYIDFKYKYAILQEFLEIFLLSLEIKVTIFIINKVNYQVF